MSDFRRVPVLGGTTLRRGGSTRGGPAHDNIIGPQFGLAAGQYTAFAQCAGQDVKDEQGHTNFWWVLIDTPLGVGWVSAVRIDEPGNDKRIDRVKTAATVFEATVPTGAHRKVPTVPGGGNRRSGGSTKGDPDNVIGTVDGSNSFPALVQCAGQDIKIDRSTNSWWVLLDTPAGRGWVSAVLIDEGGNDKPIDGVPIASTVFARPPGG